MKARKIIAGGIVLSLLSLSGPSFATGVDSTDSVAISPDTVLPFQVTFITPFGTNGYQSSKSVNYFSWNIIAGYNGGLDGLEIGGVANVLQNDMRGTQISGFANLVRQDMEGIQIAGFSNMVGGQARGFMIGGFTNHSSKSSQVIQVAGFSNQVIGSIDGAQISGFSNVSKDSTKGVQIAGFSNYSGSHSEAAQIGGFMNNTKGDLDGVQIAGFSNVSADLKGGQISGFSNVASDVDGLQVAGFVNKAKTVKGIQLGFINLADSFSSGFPIGFISNVNEGYRSFSLGVTELQMAEAQFRIGVDQFHNIFSVGLAPLPQSSGWAFGYGLGSKVWKNNTSDVIIDAIVYHINEDEIWTDALNSLIRVSSRYTFHPNGKKFGIHAGPSLNLLVSSNWEGNGDGFESGIAPYTILDDVGTYNTLKFWAGGQVGISF